MDQVPAHPGGPRAHVDGVWASGSSESRPPARGTQVLLQLWVGDPASFSNILCFQLPMAEYCIASYFIVYVL